jgi:Rieske Fe-S protein
MAAGYFLPQLAGCAAAKYTSVKTSIVDKKVVLPLNTFDKTALQLVRPTGWLYDIAVEKKPDNTYSALLLQCTHQENQLTPNGTSGFYCSFHGSKFDSNGKVLKGPAELPLQRYTTYPENGNLIIEVTKAPV